MRTGVQDFVRFAIIFLFVKVNLRLGEVVPGSEFICSLSFAPFRSAAQGAGQEVVLSI